MLKFTQEELDTFINKINKSNMGMSEKVTALETYCSRYRKHIEESTYKITGAEHMQHYKEHFTDEQSMLDRVEWLLDNDDEHDHDLAYMWAEFPDHREPEKILVYSILNND